jgi:hypothetical protein
VPKSNGYAQWCLCEICGLRVSYVPRESFHGKHATQVDHKAVEMAMKQLEMDLRPHTLMPDKDLAETMIQIHVNEAQLEAQHLKLQRLQEHQKALRREYGEIYNRLTNKPSTSSSAIPSVPTDVWRYLSADEKAKLQQIAESRHQEEEKMKEDPELEPQSRMSRGWATSQWPMRLWMPRCLPSTTATWSCWNQPKAVS